MGAVMKYKIIPFVLVLFFSKSVFASPPSESTFDGRFNSSCNAWLKEPRKRLCEVSFYRLISVPEKYNKKLIKLTGFLVNVFDRPVLFPNKSRYDADIQLEGIELVGNFKIDKNLYDKLDAGVFPVTVIGIFDATYEGADVVRLGAIKDVSSIIFREKIPER